MMKSSLFKSTLLSDVLNFFNGKSIKPGGDGQYPVYGSNGLIGRSDEYTHQNGLIIGRVGAYCGAIRYCQTHFWASDNTIVGQPKDISFDIRYIYYLLGELNLNRYAGGSAQPLLTQTVLRQVPTSIPPLPIQRKIAAVLSAYDDLIENNTRRIKILEEMAAAIYREWFVEFRFPGHGHVEMVESELGLIPQGWEVKSFGEVAFNFDRQRKPLSGMVRSTMQGEYPYYGAAKILDHINDYLFDGRYLLIAEDGSVITKDGKPVLQLVTGKFWVNNHAHVVQGIAPISTNFLYLFMSNVAISSYITGTAQPKINQDNLNRIPILSPPQGLLGRFNKVVEPLFDNIVALELKNTTLRQTRDLLLPKLISGEIDVSDLKIKISV